MKTFSTLLRKYGLRDTQSRRMVVEAMQDLRRPVSPYDIRKWIDARGDTIGIVTVYRILAVLEKLNLVHRHACSGLISLCSLPDSKGHHGFLHCHSCGFVEEFMDSALCRAEDAVAKKAKFTPLKHVSEILGLCSSCLPTAAQRTKAGVSSPHLL